MSDISINITWFDLVLYSPFWGWPGLLAGAAIGALLWRSRQIFGGALGAIIGNFAVFAARIFL